MKKLSVLVSLILMICLVPLSAGDDYRQTRMEKSPGRFDPAEYVKSMQALYQWLESEAAVLTESAIINVEVSEDEIEALDRSHCETCTRDLIKKKVRIGLVKDLDADFERGVVRETAGGAMIWTLALKSETATALRVRFSRVNLPRNAELYVYNSTGEAFGPYTGRGIAHDGEFWSHTVSGPIVYIQLHNCRSGPDSNQPFVVSGMGYLGKKFLLPFMQKSPLERDDDNPVKTHCSFNEPCVEDASCFTGGVINDAKYAVAHMQWVSGVWLYYCSGGLVADTVAGSQVPYFLTANHCLSKNKDAKSLECYWQYWTASCNGACYDPVGTVPRTLGATILSSDKTGDYTLMELKENPPAGSVFMGWTSQEVAFSDTTDLFRISYPSGAPQAYSEHRIDVDAGTCSSWPRGSWIYSRDTVGATEGGSSGSPVYNMSGQIVGQLSGACGFNVNDPCDSVSNATVDGAFASYFNAVKQWLDPGDTNQPPVADFSYQINDLTVTFTDQSTDADGSIVSWMWDFGDGQTSTAQNPVHAYGAFGTYPVILTVTDNDGAIDSLAQNVSLGGQEPDIFVQDISQTIIKQGANYKSTAIILIRDINDNPVANATVYLTWSGVVSGNASGVTDSTGQVTVTSKKVKSTGPFTVTVTNVTHPNRSYDSSRNMETSDTASY
jgi:PKD repeat protein